jgi:uncharacterized damage-inducible protein DinB
MEALMLPVQARKYMIHGLEATPVALAALLDGAPAEAFDRRPDPARFTLREMLGHLADWEGVWLERLTALAEKDHPTLQGYDEGQWAIDHNYAAMDPGEQLARFTAGRTRLLAAARRLEAAEWERSGFHTEWGEITIGAMLALVLGHDGYHLKQAVEWLKS